MKIILAVLVVLTMAGSSSAQNKADIIFTNGDIYTGASLCMSSMKIPEPCTPPLNSEDKNKMFSEHMVSPDYRAHAIAVAAGKIIATGSNEDIQKLKGAKTQVVDLGG